MKICILSMQRNEGALLETWAHYHGKLFGYENIYLFDNGSDDLLTLAVLRTLQERGINVNHEFRSRSHFFGKGRIVVDKIQELDQTPGEYDFYFPLDCDEFLSACDDQGYYFDANTLLDSLRPYIGSSNPLRISRLLVANPIRRDQYAIDTVNEKSFFYRGTAQRLDIGFHVGITASGSDFTRTPICYVHLHYLSYLETQYRSLQKLRGRVRTFSQDNLSSFCKAGKNGLHVVPDLLGDRPNYYGKFFDNGYFEVPGFRNTLATLGLEPNLESLMDFDYAAGRAQILSTPVANGPDDSFSGHVTILHATYGNGDCVADVTVRLQELIDKGTSPVTASNALFGDPCPNELKSLRVSYQLPGDDRLYIQQVPEHQALLLPEGAYEGIAQDDAEVGDACSMA